MKGLTNAGLWSTIPPGTTDHGRDLKGLAGRVRDLDRALFRVVFRLKWAPLTSVMRAFTVAGTAAPSGLLCRVAFLLTGLQLPNLLVPWAA